MRQRKALLLTQLADVSIAQMAREIGLPLERGGARAAGRRRRVHPAPRGPDRGHPCRLRAARAGDRRQPLAAGHDHPARRRRPPAYPHHRGRDRRGGGVPGQRRPGHRRGRRTTHPGPSGRAGPTAPTTDRGRRRPRCCCRTPAGDRHPARLDLRPPLLDRGTHRRQRPRARRDVLPCQREPYADPAGAEALVRTFSGTGEGPRVLGGADGRGLDDAEGRPAHLPHPGRLVRRLRRLPGPADRDPHRRAGRRPGAPVRAALLGPPGHHHGGGGRPHRAVQHDHRRQHRDRHAAGRRRLGRAAGHGRRRPVRPRRTPAAAPPIGPHWSSPRRSRSARRRPC